MANDQGHGGYRRPTNPAPVSNPGRESARTDRGPRQMDVTGGSYGSSKEFQQQQSGAPLSGAPGSPSGPPAPPVDPSASLVGLGAPSQMPGTPVTDGAAAGAGVGPEALGLRAPDPTREEARALGPWLSTMIERADDDGATPAFRKYVRELIRNL